jgi:hypothetical protein
LSLAASINLSTSRSVKCSRDHRGEYRRHAKLVPICKYFG